MAFPEGGTAAELAAMTFHAARTHDSFTPEGNPALFITNGRPIRIPVIATTR
jgi:hypothetical protein